MNPRKTILLIFLYCCIAGIIFCKDLCSLCSEQQEESVLTTECTNLNQTGQMLVNHSCCVNKTLTGEKQIYGLDLSSCNLKGITGLLNYLHNLQILVLDNNTDLTVTIEDFRGLSNLKYLSLPVSIQCPGGNDSWQETKSEPNRNICLEEIDLCIENNVTCLNKNSHCILMAPGEIECLCNDGYHGYKCLRQGYFPYSGYAIVLCVCTVVIALFLWCTQRRHVKSYHND